MRAICACLLILLTSTAAIATPRTRTDESGRTQRPRISAGNLFACTVKADGTVNCWGDNSRGQLGFGSTALQSLTPVRVSGSGGVDAVSVSAGFQHACSLRVDGIVFCWGANDNGQLGDGTTMQRNAPVQVKGLPKEAVAIAAGGFHNCALLIDGTIACWGSNADYQLGNGTSTGSLQPQVVSSVSGFISVTAGQSHTCALKVDGTVYCWGRSDQGEAGDYPTGGDVKNPLQLALSGVVGITAGAAHSCAVLVDGTARCWGANGSGQLGIGTSLGSSANPQKVSGLGGIVGISAGALHTCATLYAGNVRCWGRNASGELGIGSTGGSLLSGTTDVVALADDVEVSAGGAFTCALDSGDGGLCWGANGSGQHGNGITTPSNIPDTVSRINGSVSARWLDAGFDTTCAIRADSTAPCWGQGAVVGVNTELNPTAIAGLTGAIRISLRQHSADTLYLSMFSSYTNSHCYGKTDSNGAGSVFSCDDTNFTDFGPDRLVAVTAGNAHACALRADGMAMCWGANDSGQLSDGTFTNRSFPASVLTPGDLLSNIVQIVAGYDFTCALIADGSVQCWGRNDSGQLGTASGIPSAFPATVIGLSNVVALSSSAASSMCALLVDGTMRCWGNNASGQLGDGTKSNRFAPVAVIGMSKAAQAVTGATHSCAVLASGIAQCWGKNDSGDLAAADTADHLTPTNVIVSFTTVQSGGGTVTIPIPLSFNASIHVGTSHTCSRGAGGGAACWGANRLGQMGNGMTNGPVLRPSSVPSFTANVARQVELRSNGRIAEVTALVNCAEGQRAYIELSIIQGSAAGTGRSEVQCTGGLSEYPMVVPAQGPNGFTDGAATAQVHAVIYDGSTVTDDLHWTRVVTIVQ